VSRFLDYVAEDSFGHWGSFMYVAISIKYSGAGDRVNYSRQMFPRHTKSTARFWGAAIVGWISGGWLVKSSWLIIGGGNGGGNGGGGHAK